MDTDIIIPSAQMQWHVTNIWLPFCAQFCVPATTWKGKNVEVNRQRGKLEFVQQN